MKKVFSIIFLVSFTLAAVCPIMVYTTAEAVSVAVTADEGWEQATYDPFSTVLTNVSEGYSFKIARNDEKRTAILASNGVQTSAKIVLPSAFAYNDSTYIITGIKAYILGNSNSSVEEVIVSEGITVLGAPSESKDTAQTFRSAAALKSIKLPSTLTSLSSNCFMGCTSLLSINIPEEVTAIPSQAFSGCKALTTVTFQGNNLMTIGDSGFNNCSALTSINNFPSSVTSIGASAFSQTAITEFEIPANVTEIKNNTFSNAQMLASVVFKGNIEKLGTNIFQYCKLNTITFEGDTAPTILGSFGDYKGTGMTVYYPADSTGYDSPAFRAFFPNTIFAQMGMYNTIFINISPGKSESEVNATWYSVDNTQGAILQIAPKTDDTDFPIEGVQSFTATQEDTGTGILSNKATATGLTPNTEYVYRVGDGTSWSFVYTYHLRESTSFDFLFTTDTHIGAGRSLEADAIAWTDTISKAAEKYPNASLLLSSGDQADKGTDSQFNKFFEPSALRSLLIAPVGGSNHDDVANFKYHFNLPNPSNYGITNSGSDYYFTYGDALFMVLNTSNSNVTTHRNFMNKTVEENPGYKWKFVMFHHSIFSAGTRYPLNGNSYVNDLRKNLSPTFNTLGIDAIFMGHDHGYARTYIMDGITPQPTQSVDEDGRIVNATGVQYITGNSSSGNKFYDLADPLPDWVKVADESHPTFSGISIRGNSMTITTYRTDIMEIIDSVTICKEDALTLENANIILSADKDILSMVNEEVQLTLKAKQGEEIDLQNAKVFYETTEDGTLAISKDGKVTIENILQEDKHFRIWAKVMVGDQTFVSNAVKVCVKGNQDFSVLVDQISYAGRKADIETPIPVDTSVLPTDIEALIVNVPLVKNRPTDKNLTFIAGLYNRENEMIAVIVKLINNKEFPMVIEQEYSIPIELNIPNEISAADLYAKVFFWSDIVNLTPVCENIEIAK